MQVIIGTRDAGVSHVPAQIEEHGVDIDTSSDPSVQIAERELDRWIGTVGVPLRLRHVPHRGGAGDKRVSPRESGRMAGSITAGVGILLCVAALAGCAALPPISYYFPEAAVEGKWIAHVDTYAYSLHLPPMAPTPVWISTGGISDVSKQEHGTSSRISSLFSGLQ